MAGTDINTWKMKRKQKYEKPTAMRMSDRDLTGVTGGAGQRQGEESCGSGILAFYSCRHGGDAYPAECCNGNDGA